MSLDEVLNQANTLSATDQARLVAELSRTVLSRRLAELGVRPEGVLPLSDDEINRLVHEARGEALRASGY